MRILEYQRSVHEKKSETKKIPSISLIKKIDSLQNYYSGIIKIDTDRFENINLSKIDMNVIFLWLSRY